MKSQGCIFIAWLSFCLAPADVAHCQIGAARSAIEPTLGEMQSDIKLGNGKRFVEYIKGDIKTSMIYAEARVDGAAYEHLDGSAFSPVAIANYCTTYGEGHQWNQVDIGMVRDYDAVVIVSRTKDGKERLDVMSAMKGADGRYYPRPAGVSASPTNTAPPPSPRETRLQNAETPNPNPSKPKATHARDSESVIHVILAVLLIAITAGGGLLLWNISQKKTNTIYTDRLP